MNSSKYLSKSRYGAFELKAKYRWNMLLGTMISALLAIATTAGAFLFTQSDSRPVVNINKTKIDSVKVVVGPDIIIIPERPKGGSSPKHPSLDSRGPILMVEDDEAINDEVNVASLFDPYYAGPIGDDTGDIGSYIDNPAYGNGGDGADYYPDPNKFVSCEVMPEMIYEHEPDYPRLAQTAGMEAVVWVKALVDIDGSVRDVMIFISSNSKAGFDEAAMKAAYKCKYKPGIQNGRPVPVWVSYSVEFVLEGSW